MSQSIKYRVHRALTAEDVQAAQALRYAVFQLDRTPAYCVSQLDRDEFDSAADHLMLTSAQGELVGTCRLLSSELLNAANRDQRAFYSATEFDFTHIPDDVLQRGVELGRLAIVDAHRNGTALMSLWTAIGSYMQSTHKRYLFGCVSIAGTDVHAATRMLHLPTLAGSWHPTLRIAPRGVGGASCSDPTLGAPSAQLPPLLRLYLAAGAHICSAPACDPNFEVCDVWTLLDTETMRPNYRARFFSGSAVSRS
jgi:putative hemolysin